MQKISYGTSSQGTYGSPMGIATPLSFTIRLQIEKIEIQLLAFVTQLDSGRRMTVLPKPLSWSILRTFFVQTDLLTYHYLLM